MNAADYVPFGHQNAVSRSALSKICGLTDRECRRQIETAIKEGMMIINLGDGCGYFKPIPGIEDYMVQYVANINRARTKELIAKSIAYERWLQ